MINNIYERKVIFIELDDKWWKKDSYKFCKFPKAFLMNPEYKNLTHSAMVFYAALIDRMSLKKDIRQQSIF